MVALNDDGEELEALQRHGVRVCQDHSKVGKEFLEQEFVELLRRLSVLLRLVEFFLTDELRHVVSE